MSLLLACLAWITARAVEASRAEALALGALPAPTPALSPPHEPVPPPAAPPVAPPVVEARLSGGAAPGAPPAGATVLLVERHDLPLVRVDLRLDTTALVAGGRLRGATLEALGVAWAEGPRGARRGWRAAVEERGGQVEVGCVVSHCVVALVAPAEALADLIPALGDVVRAPALPAAALARWRPAALWGWRSTCRNRAGLEEVAVDRLLWPDGHPRRDERTAADFRLTRADLVSAWRTILAEAAPTVVAVGDISRDPLLAALEPAFGHLAGTTGTEVSGRLPARAEVVLVDHPGDRPVRVRVAWPAPATEDPDHAAWQLVANALLAGTAARLPLRLRERDGLTYDVDGAYYDQPGHGRTEVGLVVSSEEVGVALRTLDEELDRMRRDGPTPDELARAVRAAWAHLPAETATYRALAFLLWGERYAGFGPGGLYRRLPAYAAVTLEEARAAAARWLAEPRLVVVTGDREQVEPALTGAGIAVTTHWTPGDVVGGGACPD